MLAKGMRPSVARKVLYCFNLDGFNDQTRFDISDILEMETLERLRKELPWIRAAFGVTAVPTLRNTLTRPQDAVKLLRQVVRVGGGGKYRLTYKTAGVRNFKVEGYGKNSSRSIYYIDSTSRTGR